MPLIPLFLQAGIAGGEGAKTRSRMMNFCNSYDYILPVSDGTIDASDRAHLLGVRMTGSISCFRPIFRPRRR